MNKLRSIGFIYFICRDIGKKYDPVLSVGFMRQTGPPWKTGKGIQVRLNKFVVQVGLCRANRNMQGAAEESGLLYAMQGRLLDEKPSEIRNW